MAISILIFALLNLAIGYAAGVYLGYSPIDLPWDWRRSPNEEVATPAPASPEKQQSADQPKASATPAKPTQPASDSDEDQFVIRLDDTEESAVAVDDSSEEAPPQNPKPKPPAGLPALLHDFCQSVSRFHDELTTLDDIIVAGGQAHIAMRSCTEGFDTAKNAHLEELRAGLDQVDQHKAELAGQADASSRIEYIVREQIKKVEANWNCIEALDVAAQEDAALAELAQLLRDLAGATRYALDELNVATLDIERNEGRLPAVQTQDHIDSTTKLPARIAVEGLIARLWEDDAERKGNLSVALVSLDLFRQVQFEHGLQVGKRVLAAAAKIIADQTTADELAARYAGHQFVIVFPDKTPRQCSQKIELIRQQIEQTALVSAANSIQVTVSCALITASPDDTFATLFERLEETTLEAKRYGRNRTFIHEGKYPAPLAPAQLDIAPAHVEIS